MAILTSDTYDITEFLMPDFQSISFSRKEVVFSKTGTIDVSDTGTFYHDVEIRIMGDFSRTGDIISGKISSIEYEHSTDAPSSETWYEWRGELSFDEGVFVSDLSALQNAPAGGSNPLLAGDDQIYGLTHGGGGSDTFHMDRVKPAYGGAGYDRVVFDLSVGRILLDLNRVGSSFKSIEEFVGSRQSDQLRGTAGDDRLFGSNGNDLLVGRAGDDKLDGGPGADTLIASLGSDVLTGGGGDDIFVYERVADSTQKRFDVITDFSRADDIIDLSTIDANVEKTGNQSFKWIGTSSYGGNAGELKYSISGEKTFIRGDVDGDGKTDFQIVLDDAIKLTASDFLL